MSHHLMTQAYQANSPFVWPLAARQAVTLGADPATRQLWVHEGRVWLTRRCEGGTPQDVWLDAGLTPARPGQARSGRGLAGPGATMGPRCPGSARRPADVAEPPFLRALP